jgi:phage terminase large subunit
MVKTKISNYSRPISEGFDFSAPDYGYAITRRHFMVKWMRSGTKEERRDKLASLYRAYRANPAQMIEDWGCTYDPRNAGQLDENDEAIPTIMPFVLFPKQKEWVDWAVDRWLNKQEGVTEKSRDMGVSWLAVALSCCLCVLYPEMAIGFGSRKEDYVDKAGFPRSLFFKGRLFMDNMPLEFSAGWSRKTDAHMRLTFPATKSVITGEAGDSIGRGDRTGLYFTDEDAQIEHPDSVDASLSATTDCRIRVSSANGTANSFYLKRQQYVGKEQLFTLHWRSKQPRRDGARVRHQLFGFGRRRVDTVVLGQRCNGRAQEAGVRLRRRTLGRIGRSRYRTRQERVLRGARCHRRTLGRLERFGNRFDGHDRAYVRHL